MKRLKQLALKVAYSLLRVYWFLVRPEITGVRCLLIKDKKVLLIQHSYGSDRWTLPGGGTKATESPADSAKREALEEVGLVIPDLNELGYIFCDREYKRDTIWVFQADVRTEEYTIDNVEIINAQWFPLENLPENSSQLLSRFVALYTK